LDVFVAVLLLQLDSAQPALADPGGHALQTCKKQISGQIGRLLRLS